MASAEQPVVQASLEVNRKHLLQAFRQIKAIKGRRRQPAKLTYTDGQLRISLEGCSFSAEATGTWTGEVEVPDTFIRRVARTSLPGKGPVVVATDGKTFRIEEIVIGCRWNAIVYPRIELPLDAPTVEVLSLSKKYSTEDIERSGLVERVREAEQERDSMFKEAETLLQRAVEVLWPLGFRGKKPLGIDGADLRRMLDERLRQQAAL
jgi:hypothetical protein